MPLRKLIAEEHISTEIATAMHKAFNAVQAYIAKNKIKGVTGSTVVRKVFDAVIAGEHDAAKVAGAIIKTLTAKKA